MLSTVLLAEPAAAEFGPDFVAPSGYCHPFTDPIPVIGSRYRQLRPECYPCTSPHIGTDYTGSYGRTIHSIGPGHVFQKGTLQGPMGNWVRIQHPNGVLSRYLHMRHPTSLAIGDPVSAGTPIGLVGRTGLNSTSNSADHLHLETSFDGKLISPEVYLSNSPAAGAVAPGSPAERAIMEISVSGGQWTAQPVGVSMTTHQFSVVDMGRSNGDLFACEGGTLRHLEPTPSGWKKHDSGFALDATSLSAVNVGQAWPHILAIENNQLYHVYADAAGWHKGPTNITVGDDARVSAVLLPGNDLQAGIADNGRLYHVTTSNGWQKWDTSAPCGPELKATYHSGTHPTVSTILNGQVYQIYGAPGAWSAQPTGQQASGWMTAVNPGNGYPQVFANEGWNIVQTSVGANGWERNGMYPSVVVSSRIDGFTRLGAYPVLYAG